MGRESSVKNSSPDIIDMIMLIYTSMVLLSCRIIGGRDAEAKGTWLAIDSESGSTPP